MSENNLRLLQVFYNLLYLALKNNRHFNQVHVNPSPCINISFSFEVFLMLFAKFFCLFFMVMAMPLNALPIYQKISFNFQDFKDPSRSSTGADEYEVDEIKTSSYWISGNANYEIEWTFTLQEGAQIIENGERELKNGDSPAELTLTKIKFTYQNPTINEKVIAVLEEPDFIEAFLKLWDREPQINLEPHQDIIAMILSKDGFGIDFLKDPEVVSQLRKALLISLKKQIKNKDEFNLIEKDWSLAIENPEDK